MCQVTVLVCNMSELHTQMRFKRGCSIISFKKKKSICGDLSDTHTKRNHPPQMPLLLSCCLFEIRISHCWDFHDKTNKKNPIRLRLFCPKADCLVGVLSLYPRRYKLCNNPSHYMRLYKDMPLTTLTCAISTYLPLVLSSSYNLITHTVHKV